MTRVLVVDDSAFMRRLLSRMLERGEDIEVAGTAENGAEALELVRSLQPDVVTLDVQMRGMDGLEALRHIVARGAAAPAVIMVSSFTTKDARTTLDALALGAVDFIAKPDASAGTREISALGDELIAKVRACGQDRAQRRIPAQGGARHSREWPQRRVECVGIGTSTGGPVALQKVLPRLPRDFGAPIVIAQHMPPGFTASLAERLAAASEIGVREGREGAALCAGCAVIAPSGHHARIERKGEEVRLALEPADSPGLSPSVDLLFASVGEVYGSGALAVVLTGMGRDGVDGLRSLKAAGGHAVGQDAASCTIYGMPRAAAEAGLLDRVVPLEDLPRLLCEVTGLGVPLQRQEGSQPRGTGT